jgi:hypothetical protein
MSPIHDLITSVPVLSDFAGPRPSIRRIFSKAFLWPLRLMHIDHSLAKHLLHIAKDEHGWRFENVDA